MTQAQTPQPKLSIVVPCYNVEEYLPTCLESLLAQDLPGIEIVCVDDGSTDSTPQVIARYEQAYPDHVRGVSQENAGSWQARLTGINAANGDYISFLDGDDTATPDYARSLYIAASSANADIAVCGYERTDLATGRVLSRELCSVREPVDLARDPGQMITINTAVWNKAFRARVLKDIVALDARPQALEDVALMLLAFAQVTGPIVFVPKPCVHYMVREGSQIGSTTPAQVESGRQALLEVRGRYEQAGLSEHMLQALDAVAFLHLGVSMALRLSANQEVNLGEELRLNTAFLNEHFPTWKRSPYISASYARRHGGGFTKLLIAQRFYRARLMGPFLAAYRLITTKLGIDIKW